MNSANDLVPIITYLHTGDQAMIRPGSRTETGNPKEKKRPLARMDRPSARLLRLVLTAGLAVVLAVVLIKIIIPNQDDRPPRPDAVKTVIPESTAEGRLEPSGEAETSGRDDTGETVRTYRGQGGAPADDPTLTWEITLAISGRTLQLLEGAVVEREFAGDPPTTDFSFSITPDRYEMDLSQSEIQAFRLGNAYDYASAAPFSIDEKGQFYIYLTPKKLSLQPNAIPSRFLTKRDNSPLISMQGFIKPDDTIVGTLNSVFGPDIEYVLEPSTGQ